jgi:hypothetical protein
MKALLKYNTSEIEVEIESTLAMLSTLLEFMSTTDNDNVFANDIRRQSFDFIEEKYLELGKYLFNDTINSVTFASSPQNFGYVDIVTFNTIE